MNDNKILLVSQKVPLLEKLSFNIDSKKTKPSTPCPGEVSRSLHRNHSVYNIKSDISSVRLSYFSGYCTKLCCNWLVMFTLARMVIVKRQVIKYLCKVSFIRNFMKSSEALFCRSTSRRRRSIYMVKQRSKATVDLTQLLYGPTDVFLLLRS